MKGSPKRRRVEVEIFGDENELLWIPREQDFSDGSVFAGEGNIGHIMKG